MTLTRRALAAGVGAAALGRRIAYAEDLPPRSYRPVGVAVRALPIEAFYPKDRTRRRFGSLTYRSGLALTGDYKGFGGFSGLWRSGDGRRLVSLSDHGEWLTAEVELDGPRLVGLSGVVMAPVLGADGIPVAERRRADTESLAITGDGVAFVGLERSHEVMRFDWRGQGTAARGHAIPVPDEFKQQPPSKGAEALGVAPLGHPLAGAVIAISERSRSGDDAPTRGFILTGDRQGAFDVARSKAFDITDLTFAASGEMLLLERDYAPQRGVSARIRRIAPDAIAPGALVDGPVIFEVGPDHEIDNMEGIALHRDPAGATVVSLISDDNFSLVQRTLLLEFTLEAD